MYIFLTLVISEGMATITYNCAIYKASFQEHLQKYGRNELQAKMNRRSQNMSWEAQTQGPQQGCCMCTEGSRALLFFPRELLDLREKRSTVEVMGKSGTGWRIPRENELMSLNQNKSVTVTVHRYFKMNDKMAFIFCILI